MYVWEWLTGRSESERDGKKKAIDTEIAEWEREAGEVFSAEARHSQKSQRSRCSLWHRCLAPHVLAHRQALPHRRPKQVIISSSSTSIAIFAIFSLEYIHGRFSLLSRFCRGVSKDFIESLYLCSYAWIRPFGHFWFCFLVIFLRIRSSRRLFLYTYMPLSNSFSFLSKDIPSTGVLLEKKEEVNW